MIITDIIELSRSKYKVFIDGEFAFVLYKGELRQLKIKIGEELDSSTYINITEMVLPKRAKLRAMHLLEKRPYTEYAMRAKLKENFYSEEIIDLAIDYLKGYKYIDDFSYSMQYIETYASSKSEKRIKQDLMMKGVSSAIITSAIDECRENGDLGGEKAMIQDILRKRHFGEGEVSQKDIAKTINHLLGKGFSYDAIKYVMHKYLDD